MLDYNYYKLYSNLYSFKKKLDYSCNLITKVIKKSKTPYIAWSGGKDSTALMYLITQYLGYKDILVFCQKDDLDFPNEIDYINRLSKKYDLNLKLYTPLESVFDYIINNNIDVISKDIHDKSNIITKKFFLSLIKKFIKIYNPDTVFMGLRIEESGNRRMNYVVNGDSYYCKYDKMGHCNPLSMWTTDDIFSFLIINNVEIFELYNTAITIKDADNIRKSWWLPTNYLIGDGQVRFIKENYPNLFNKLKENYPELSAIV
jgi:3'-phosphoadenosine 5'-phosphosulfate sulfotransferase (PAPS reductase)/FAD synthetase